LGYYGNKGLIIFAAAILLYSLLRYGKLKKRYTPLIAAVFASGFLGGEKGMSTCLALLLLYILFLYNRKAPKFFNYNVYIAVICAYFVGIVLLRLQYHFSWLIVDILGKDLTFSYRTYIWDYALLRIIKNPLIGNGFRAPFGYELVSATIIFDAHNLFLQILYSGGVLAFISLIITLVLAGKPLMKYKDNPVAQLISFSIFVSLTVAMTWDFLIYAYLAPLFLMANHAEALITPIKSKETQREGGGFLCQQYP
jgi:O-antigen ligase